MLVGDSRVTVCGPGVSIFVDILVELTNTVFVNSINITTDIEPVALSSIELLWQLKILQSIEKTQTWSQLSAELILTNDAPGLRRKKKNSWLRRKMKKLVGKNTTNPGCQMKNYQGSYFSPCDVNFFLRLVS